MTDTHEEAEGQPKGGLGRSTALFSFWTAVSRVAGLIREVVAAALFGTQGAINAFVIAFQVPNLLRSLVADSAISGGVVLMLFDEWRFARQRPNPGSESA